MRATWTSNGLIAAVALFLVAAGNLGFFSHVLDTYPPASRQTAALLSLVFVLWAATTLLLSLLCIGRATKPVLIGVLMAAAASAYFMDTYNVVIDAGMLSNVFQTNAAEARDLLSLKLMAYLLVLGVLPGLVVARLRLAVQGWRPALLARAKLLMLLLLAMTGVILAFGGFYASFAREHKVLRTYANPAYPVYSLVKYARSHLVRPHNAPPAVVGADAAIPPHDRHRELIVLVIGETARADRFSLNGYPRETTPLLARAGAISLTNFHACGTSTAVSVPCMFSPDGSKEFNSQSIFVRENLLDVLSRAGVNILWRDNNSDSKGVALRTTYEDFRSPARNPVCDDECRDEGMLAGLQDYVDAHPQGDILIVLHQMGNHGPAYYKRYPQAFEKFSPTCRSSDLNRCSQEEIDNAYDNAILYTDRFLAQTIEFLGRNDARFETAMFYVSDHGESLGEKGVYLHGLPRAIAPEAQLHVAAAAWFGAGYDDIDVAALRANRDMPLSHDHLFHTLLGLLEIKTTAYRQDLDFLAACCRRAT